MPLPSAKPPQDHPVLRGLTTPPPVEWTVEEIMALDWYRLAELLRAVAINAGCQLGPSRVSITGAVQFAMLATPKARDPRRSLVALAAWNQWAATPESVNTFAWEIGRIREKTSGILVAPAGATPAATSRAMELGIEIVDAVKLCRTLTTLHPEQSSFFHKISLAGDWQTPTCPVCLNKLTRVQQAAPTGPMRRPDELTFQASTVVPEPVDCERLEVSQGCEVTFLHEVRARREVVIRGHASGDFICQGTFALVTGGSFQGTVAARAIDIQSGADFQGQSRILDNVTEPVQFVQMAWFWRCQHPASTPECRKITFEPHTST